MARQPHYRRIAEDLRRQILDGELRPGEQLPSTAKLMEIYGAGNNAVFHAVTKLTDEGLIEGHQGKGRFVVDRS